MLRPALFVLMFLFTLAAGLSETVAEASLTEPRAECQSCTARHKSLQSLQRAMAERACPGTAGTPCASSGEEEPNAAEPPQPGDDTVLRLPDGQPAGSDRP